MFEAASIRREAEDVEPARRSVPVMSESRTGEVGCGGPAADGRTVVSVSAPGGRRVGVELLVIIVSPATRTGTGAACKSGVPLLAGTSCVPVQASADATATAVIARGIFGKCILLLYVDDGRETMQSNQEAEHRRP